MNLTTSAFLDQANIRTICTRVQLLVVAVAIACLGALAFSAAAQATYPAQGNFGINSFDFRFTNANDTPATQAGSHPFAVTGFLEANVDGNGFPEGRLRDIFLTQVPGLVGDTTAYPRCSTLEFLEVELESGVNACPVDTAVGISANAVSTPGNWFAAPVFNLTPPPGVLLRLGFRAVVENVVLDITLSPDPPYLPVVSSRNVPQLADFFGNKTQIWGDPSDPKHDELRGRCGARGENGLPPGDLEAFEFKSDSGEICPVAPRPEPFLTLPTNCEKPLTSSFKAFSWEGDTDSGSVPTHDAGGNPTPFTGCGKLDFHPSIAAQPTNKAAESPTGLDFSLDVEDEGLTSVKGTAQSHVRKVVVTLPEGMTANPSQAEGLEVCSEDDLAEETLSAAPGEGCPQASKIGTLEVESPLVEDPIKGSLFVAKPFENLAEDSLIAVYVVFKNPKLGIVIKQPLKVSPDPRTGQLITTAEEIPQLPFSHFRLHFREGGRSPLVTPPRCGTYEVKARMTPWSGTAPIETSASFDVIAGPSAGPCPPAGPQPFQPGFEAGSASNSAGTYSPFSMRLTRRDGDQDMTRFDATLPPGVGGILAGISKCSDAQIARAKAKTGIAERQSPSCPANSKIGTVQGGAGVGSQLTYVPGSIYLAGPFGGAPISAVAIVPAVAGPFDVGTVVYRQALVIDPRSGEVTADGTRSDPLPHILAGIPLRVRDVQVHIDRPKFIYNPTSCDPFATEASIWGGGANPFSIADDRAVKRKARFQAANCSRLGFKPNLSLKLQGGTKRAEHPRLRSVYAPKPGGANLKNVVVRFPRSAFLDQAHIRTICTRVQFAAKACPPGAVYGHARVFTPILDEPLEGPLYLRSSNHNLPDVVLALHGLVDVEGVARVDSKKGGIRVSFTNLPDAPLSKAVVTMQGGKKGLIVNSTNLCANKHRANVQLDAQNQVRRTINPVVQASCH